VTPKPPISVLGAKLQVSRQIRRERHFGIKMQSVLISHTPNDAPQENLAPERAYIETL